MNATVARLEPEIGASPCTEELTQINESLRRREGLLAASAKASRLLLESEDARVAIPGVLRLIGEAAGVAGQYRPALPQAEHEVSLELLFQQSMSELASGIFARKEHHS